MLIHTYYGYTASGGPAGVGEAVGRAVRSSLIFLGPRSRHDLAGRVRPIGQLQPGGLTMDEKDGGLHPAWYTLILLVIFAVLIWLTYALFVGSLRPVIPVTLTSDRSGLVLETNAKVKLRGVQVGRVAAIKGGTEPVALTLEIDKDKVKYIPANVEAQIRATTVFGAKFVDLTYPSDPSPQRLSGRPGAEVEQRHRRGQYRFPERRQSARPGRPGQTQQHTVGARRRCPRPRRTDRTGHHRCQSGAARTESAQRDDPRGLAGAQRVQRRLQSLRRRTS